MVSGFATEFSSQIWGITGLLLDTPPGVIDLSQWKELDCAYQNNYAYNWFCNFLQARLITQLVYGCDIFYLHLSSPVFALWNLLKSVPWEQSKATMQPVAGSTLSPAGSPGHSEAPPWVRTLAGSCSLTHSPGAHRGTARARPCWGAGLRQHPTGLGRHCRSEDVK